MKFILSLATLSLVIAPVVNPPPCPIGTTGCASTGIPSRGGGSGGARSVTESKSDPSPIVYQCITDGRSKSDRSDESVVLQCTRDGTDVTQPIEFQCTRGDTDGRGKSGKSKVFQCTDGTEDAIELNCIGDKGRQCTRS